MNQRCVCPVCRVERLMDHDQWEDMFRCVACQTFFEPEEIGLKTDRAAGIFHLNKPEDA